MKKVKKTRRMFNGDIKRGPSKAQLKQMQRPPKGSYTPEGSALAPVELARVDSLRVVEPGKTNLWVTILQGGAAGTR